ncbi:MAG: OmpA family protein [Bacteroidales bacterium]|nr:OmpA family protein [Bacteroidales bacterium]
MKKSLAIYYIIMCAAVMCGTEAVAQNAGNAKQKVNGVCSRLTEIAPVESADGKRLYFARISPENNPEKNCDIWYADIESDGSIGKAQKLPKPVNSVADNVVIKADGNMLFLEGVYDQNFNYVSPDGITKAVNKNGAWTVTKQTIKNLDNRNRHSSYALSSDNKVLIIAAEREGGTGLLDLHVSFLTAENTYSQPLNLGTVVNTKYNDGTPWLAPDNTTLYFSSYGHNSKGSADVFMTRRLDDSWTNWSEPANLGAEINSKYWDSYLSLSADGKRAYMVSTDANADENIYCIELQPPVQPLENYIVRGTVHDKKRHEPMPAKVIIKDAASGNVLTSCYSNEQGQYSLTVDQCGRYTVETEAENFFAWENKIYVKKDKHIYINNIDLAPIEKGVAFTLKNIYFKPASHRLDGESWKELNRLARLMKNNPSLRLTVNGYTASGMDSKELKLLSENRAKAVKTYLVQQGVKASRITCNGYGEITDPEEKGNRKRVEFVLSY